jgi:hypothetical protein
MVHTLWLHNLNNKYIVYRTKILCYKKEIRVRIPYSFHTTVVYNTDHYNFVITFNKLTV